VLDRLPATGRKPCNVGGIGDRKALNGGRPDAVYSTAIYRMMGQHTLLAFLPYSNANEHVAKMAREILPAVKEAPCIVGIGAHDPSLNQDKFMDEMMSMGFSGVTNEPFAGIYGPEFAAQLESAGLGFSKEEEMIALAHRKGIFTFGWASALQKALQDGSSRCRRGWRAGRRHCRRIERR
jgi:predicted TIM-barrel enzyme